jgi:hypothetical protein
VDPALIKFFIEDRKFPSVRDFIDHHNQFFPEIPLYEQKFGQWLNGKHKIDANVIPQILTLLRINFDDICVPVDQDMVH